MRADAMLVAAILAVPGVLAAPAAAQEPVARVVLRWQAVPGAAGYELQVATDRGFAHRELDQRVQVAGYRLGPPPESPRYWRVRTVDADGRPGPWSSVKVIEPRRAEPEAAAPPPEPAPTLLAVPPLPAARIARAKPLAGSAPTPIPLRPIAGEPLPAPGLVEQPEGFRLKDVLREIRPGVLLGWRHNLLGVDAPALALEATVWLPWLGASYWGAVRGGWWRERVTVDTADTGFEATADVLPLQALLLRSFEQRWARPYAGIGLGADLVFVRTPHQGALEASAAAWALLGAGRRLGRGELFAEAAGSLGGVDGPLGRLRTGGVSLSVGYRLGR